MFRNPFSFEGRIRRMEFGLTWLAYWAVIIIVNVTAEAAPYLGLICLPMIWILLAQGAKRCHDMGRNGWWQIIPFYVFVMIFQQGDGEANEYGYPPLRGDEMNKMSLESEIQSIGENNDTLSK